MVSLKRAFSAFVLAVGFSASAMAAPIVIDDFNVPPAGNVVTRNTNGTAVGSQTRAGIIGGDRDYSATRTVGTVAAGTFSKIGGNVFTVDNNSNTGRGIGRLHYDGTAGGFLTTGLDVDLTDMGTNNQFQFKDFSVNGTQPLNIAQTMSTTVTDVFGGTFTLVQGLMIQGGNYTIAFSNFSGAGVDMTRVASIDFQFDNRVGFGQAGSDVESSFLEANMATPEPGTIVLALTGAAGLAFVARRKKNS